MGGELRLPEIAPPARAETLAGRNLPLPPIAPVHNKSMEAERVYKDLLWQDPGRMSGALCLYGTRIPVTHLFSYLENGSTVEEFCKDYHVELRVAKAVLELAPEGMELLLTKAA